MNVEQLRQLETHDAYLWCEKTKIISFYDFERKCKSFMKANYPTADFISTNQYYCGDGGYQFEIMNENYDEMFSILFIDEPMEVHYCVQKDWETISPCFHTLKECFDFANELSN